jgi:hypothetical protein
MNNIQKDLAQKVKATGITNNPKPLGDNGLECGDLSILFEVSPVNPKRVKLLLPSGWQNRNNARNIQELLERYATAQR